MVKQAPSLAHYSLIYTFIQVTPVLNLYKFQASYQFPSISSAAGIIAAHYFIDAGELLATKHINYQGIPLPQLGKRTAEASMQHGQFILCHKYITPEAICTT